MYYYTKQLPLLTYHCVGDNHRAKLPYAQQYKYHISLTGTSVQIPTFVNKAQV